MACRFPVRQPGINIDMKATATVAATLTYRSFAKINLYLQVLDRRPDGYHNIETLFQTIDLSDELSFTASPEEITLECASADLGPLENNLVYRAAKLLKERFQYQGGAHITLDKHIPVASGLAGGSGNAATTLQALNTLWELNLTQQDILDCAIELGSDVPYCAIGGTVAATGRGEILQPLAHIRERWFLLLHPDIQVSTPRVYNHPQLSRSNEDRIDGRTTSFTMAIGTLNKGALADVFYNAMEIAVFSEYPQLAVMKQRLLDGGCAASLMSGSGPTLFGLCKNREHAEELARNFPEVKTSVVASVPYGVLQVD